MKNRSIEEAIRYHETSKLGIGQTPEGHEQRDLSPKTYVGGKVTLLDRNVSMPEMSTFDALATTEFDEEIPLDLARLAQILRVASRLAEQKASAAEVYVVCSDLLDLGGGVYHLNAIDFALTHLREGDYRPDLVAAAGDNQSLAAAPATLILSGSLTGSYRTILTDTGRVLAQLLITASANQLAASVETSFVDALVDRLLGLDGVSEAAFCLIPLGRVLDWAEHVGERMLPEVSLAPRPRHLSGSLDASVAKIHVASSLLSNEETRPLRGPCPRPRGAPADDIRLDPSTSIQKSQPLEDVIGNDPNPELTNREMDASALFTIVHHATLDLPADFLEGPETSLLDPYLVVHRVKDLEPGLYAVHPDTRGLELIRSGNLEASLEKNLVSNSAERKAAAHLILTADLAAVLQRFGNRGYRLTHFEAGATAGRIGIAAQSIGFGAPLLSFFDEGMNRFLSPDADGNEVIVTLALG